MEVKKEFPFDICETCDQCVLKVDEQILFSHEDRCQRVIRVGCKNAELCKKLKEKHNGKN